MIDSRAKGRAGRVSAHLPLTLLATLLVLTAAPVPLLAQTNGPVQLLPLTGERPVDPTQIPPVDHEGIETTTVLPPPNPEAVGLLDSGAGGLPADMWVRADRAVVLHALSVLPTDAPSPARQALTQALLLTAATPPAGRSSPSLVEVRLEKLLVMGATESVRKLAEALPITARTETVDRIVADSLFVDARLDEACDSIAEGLLVHTTPYWLKGQVFCHLLKGANDQAALGMTMLHEQNAEDPTFLWAAEQLAGQRVLSLSGFPAPRPLTMAMVRATGRPYPAGTLVDPQPWLLKAVALGVGTDFDTRLKAAEQAVAAGAMTPADLAALYEAVDFNAADFKKTLSELVDQPTSRTGALFWQITQRQTIPLVTAEVVAKALENARRQGFYLSAASLYAPVIETIPHTDQFLWFTETAARALYAAGHFDAAQSWYALAAAGAPTRFEAAEARDALWPLFRLSGAPLDGTESERLDAWRGLVTRRAQEADTNEPTTRRINRLETRLLSLLQAVGQPVSMREWAVLWGESGEDQGFMPTASRWHAAGLAGRDHRVGEGVALSLLLLQTSTPGQEAEAALARAVETLRLVGQIEPARRIAVESAVAAGL